VTVAMRVFDAMPQDLVIRATGNDVVELRPVHELDEDGAPDALPDPIDLFVRAVNQQMFPLADEAACVGSARVLQRSRDDATRTATWSVRIERAHPACLRVLYNLLNARDFDSADARGRSTLPRPHTPRR
jgi:hypothetical protein